MCASGRAADHRRHAHLTSRGPPAPHPHRGPAVRGARRRARRPGRRQARERRRLRRPRRRLRGRRRADRGGHRHRAGRRHRAARRRARRPSGSPRSSASSPTLPGVASTDATGRAGDDGLVTAHDPGERRRRGRSPRRAVDVFARADGVTVGGGAVAGLQIGETVGADLGRAEMIAFPLLLLLSILFFRGRATLMPLAVGVTTVLGTFLVLVGRQPGFYGLSVFALNLVIGLGLGLAIDYTLFLVTRYREELARQGADAGAIATTMATAGPHRGVLGGDGRRRADHARRLPAGLPEVDGHRGRDRGRRRRARRAGHLARAVRPVGRASWPARAAATTPRGAVWHRLAHAVMRRAEADRPADRRWRCSRCRCPRSPRRGRRSTRP